jgi:pimeloyl-ACP methyl ester carboxylesterase
VRRIAALAGAALAAGCAALPPAAPVAGARAEAGTLVLAGAEVEATWYRADAAPAGLLLLQHGFARRCANLRETALGFAAGGFTVLCLDADMARGNAVLATALAAHLAQRADAPRLVLAGHSAGGLFAARVAAALPAARVAGVLLFDPVDAAGALAPALAAVRAPAHAFVAPPAACNAQGNARPALHAAAATVVELGTGATHLDVEGGDTERLAVAACGDGPPRAEAVTRLRAQALQAAQAMALRPAP